MNDFSEVIELRGKFLRMLEGGWINVNSIEALCLLTLNNKWFVNVCNRGASFSHIACFEKEDDADLCMLYLVDCLSGVKSC